jgi:hypothetical protein
MLRVRGIWVKTCIPEHSTVVYSDLKSQKYCTDYDGIRTVNTGHQQVMTDKKLVRVRLIPQEVHELWQTLLMRSKEELKWTPKCYSWHSNETADNESAYNENHVYYRTRDFRSLHSVSTQKTYVYIDVLINALNSSTSSTDSQKVGPILLTRTDLNRPQDALKVVSRLYIHVVSNLFIIWDVYLFIFSQHFESNCSAFMFQNVAQYGHFFEVLLIFICSFYRLCKCFSLYTSRIQFQRL